MADVELWAGGSSAVVAVVGAALKSWRTLDRRLRNLELGMARIEVVLKVKAEDSEPESDE